jgi:hypothetical protein
VLIPLFTVGQPGRHSGEVLGHDERRQGPHSPRRRDGQWPMTEGVHWERGIGVCDWRVGRGRGGAVAGAAVGS